MMMNANLCVLVDRRSLTGCRTDPSRAFNSLHAYTCVLAPEIHRYVDMGKNCEDIAVNMMISGLTGLPPVCVEEHEVLDFGTSRGISISSAFTHRRDQCTADLIKLFGRDTLIETREFVRPFDANKFRKVKWEELDNVLVSFPTNQGTWEGVQLTTRTGFAGDGARI